MLNYLFLYCFYFSLIIMEVYILKCDFFCVIDDINNEFCESLDSY